MLVHVLQRHAKPWELRKTRRAFVSVADDQYGGKKSGAIQFCLSCSLMKTHTPEQLFQGEFACMITYRKDDIFVFEALYVYR
jgi:hypothetical protein